MASNQKYRLVAPWGESVEREVTKEPKVQNDTDAERTLDERRWTNSPCNTPRCYPFSISSRNDRIETKSLSNEYISREEKLTESTETFSENNEEIEESSENNDLVGYGDDDSKDEEESIEKITERESTEQVESIDKKTEYDSSEDDESTDINSQKNGTEGTDKEEDLHREEENFNKKFPKGRRKLKIRQISARIMQLAQPRPLPREVKRNLQYDPFEISKAALKCKASKRIQRLATPIKRKDNMKKEDAFQVKKESLRARCSNRIRELAKPTRSIWSQQETTSLSMIPSKLKKKIKIIKTHKNNKRLK